MKKIFINNLPVYKEGRHKGAVDWRNSIGFKVKFIYKDLEGEIEIIDYDIKKSKLTLKYLNNKMKIYSSHFLKCSIGKLIGSLSSDHFYKIDQIINDVNSGKLKILKLIRIGSNNGKGYLYKCLICSNEDKLFETDLKKKKGCNVCAGKKVKKGINDIWTTNIQLGKLLYNKEDGYNYTSNSSKRVDFKCPFCERKIKHKPINRISTGRRVPCPFCSDNFSYSEKFTYRMLELLNIDFYFQKSFKWSNKKIYDFFIPSLSLIIETHGIQHYINIDKWTFLNEVQKNDELKEELAKKNGIKYYVILDCRKTDFNWIKNNLLNSQLNTLLKLDKVNWDNCHEYAINTTLVKKVCDLFNEGKRRSEIVEILNLSKSTVYRYLQKGNELNWCKYDPKIELEKNLGKFSKKSRTINFRWRLYENI